MEGMDLKEKGTLVIVGTGITVAGQLTTIAKNHIKQADIVYAAIPNEPGIAFIRSLNANTHTLTDLYQLGKSRLKTYQEMIDRIVGAVEAGNKVCAAFYGHPGVFVDPTHKAMAYLKEKGYSVKMEPGISAEDCLYADLGIDPAAYGCQSYEATQFLFRRYTLDPYMTQIIWQIFAAGDHHLVSSNDINNSIALGLLVDKLLRYYPASHQVIIYEARISALFDTRIETLSIDKLADAKFSAVSTLVIPSIRLPEYDTEILNSLGIDAQLLKQKSQLTEIGC
jgi:uroporphyrin-III C-methyltransferase